VISLDTEYTQVEHLEKPQKGMTEEPISLYPTGMKNRILSYQIIAVETDTSKEIQSIIYPECNKRS
jgi:hypothetical protein